MRKALLISESSVYRDIDGKMIARGGGAVCFHNIGKSLLKLGIEPTVFSIKEFDGQKVDEVIDGVLYRRMEVRSRSSFKLLKYLWQAKKDVRDYDLVFLNQFTPHLLLPRLKGVKNVVVIHDVYREMGLKFWVKEFGWFTGIIGSFVEKLQLKYDGRFADKIMTVSEGSKEKIIDALGKNIESRVYVNPYPIDANEYIYDQKKEDLILFIGRFVGYKNPEHVLYALKKVLEKYPKYKAVFVIPRSLEKVREKFEVKMRELGLTEKEVICQPCCCGGELKKYLARAKILAQPSFVEGQGIVVLEALASNTPVIAYDLSAYNRMLKNGKNAILVEKGNIESFSNAFVEMIENYEKFQKNCLVDLHKFSKDKFEKVMKELC